MKAYVSHKISKLLKEKGFDDDLLCHGGWFEWNDSPPIGQIPAPSHQEVCAWLRAKYNIHIGINPISGKGYNATIYDVAHFDDCRIISDTEFFYYVEEATETAIKYCLENLIK